jgi:hypothetical protein
MNSCTDGNPEHNENASKADHAKGDPTRLQANSPHSCYECVDSEKLVRCILAVSHTQRHEETHEGDQGDSDFTNLFDKALCCAIGPCRDDPVMSPPDIEDTTNGLQKIECEK